MLEILGESDATGTERAVLGAKTASEVVAVLERYADEVLGSPIRAVRLRSGRIDVVWGVELADGRAVAIKVHRPPADLDVLRATRDAKETLAASGFPCPAPISGPDPIDGHVFSAETLVAGGGMPGESDRSLIAGGLAGHIRILRSRPDLLERTWPGPSWCRYEDGPWPVPHDTFVDFAVTDPGYAWLDDLARRATEQIKAHRGDERVLGHADWYAGNLVVEGGRLAGSFDWEFVAEPEAVIAGFTAAAWAASPEGSEGMSTPAMAEAFLRDYADARGAPFTDDEWAAAAGAVAWILFFNARWQVALFTHGLGDHELVETARTEGEAYLSIGA